jgi:lysyl-tRNA synthetase class 2
VIEVDGSQHMQTTSYDEQRTAYVHAAGYRMLRFWDNDVLTRSSAVMETIYHALDFSPHPNPLPVKTGRGNQ